MPTTTVLADNSLKSVAAYLDSDACKNSVFVMCGAGISTSAGIPDFRSPKTGLYANLAKLNLPYPEAVFDIMYFRGNPRPFYTLARDIAPGKFIPTPTHAFIRLLHEKGKLHTCFTQNIDTLERMAGVPGDKMVEAHGSFASARCIDCETPYDQDNMREMIKKGEVPTCPECEGLVKPDIVFFGEGLPPEFRNAIPALRTKASLVIVMGTSLTVQPFSLLPNLVPISCPRLLLNMDPAGNIGAFVKDRSSSPVPAPGSGGGGPADETGLSQQSNDQEQGNVEKSGGEEKVAGHVDRQSHPDRVEASRGLSTSGLNDRSSSEQRNHEEEAREDAGDDLSDEYEDEYEDEEEDEEEEEEEEVERWQDDVVHLGDCDTSVRVLCDLLGWRDDLERLWRSVGGGGGNPDVDDVVGGGSAQATNFAAGSDKPNRVPIGAAMAEVTQSRNQDTSTSVKFINTNESNGMGRLVLSSADAELAVGVIPSTEQDKGAQEGNIRTTDPSSPSSAKSNKSGGDTSVHTPAGANTNANSETSVGNSNSSYPTHSTHPTSITRTTHPETSTSSTSTATPTQSNVTHSIPAYRTTSTSFSGGIGAIIGNESGDVQFVGEIGGSIGELSGASEEKARIWQGPIERSSSEFSGRDGGGGGDERERLKLPGLVAVGGDGYESAEVRTRGEGGGDRTGEGKGDRTGREGNVGDLDQRDVEKTLEKVVKDMRETLAVSQPSSDEQQEWQERQRQQGYSNADSKAHLRPYANANLNANSSANANVDTDSGASAGRDAGISGGHTTGH